MLSLPSRIRRDSRYKSNPFAFAVRIFIFSSSIFPLQVRRVYGKILTPEAMLTILFRYVANLSSTSLKAKYDQWPLNRFFMSVEYLTTW